MLPRNIDLREGSNDISVFSTMDEEIPYEVYTQEAMSLGQYHWLEWFEGIFGKKYCWSEKHKLFPDFHLYVNNGCYCERCGKEIRIPWMKVYDLCLECNEALEVDRAPWFLENNSNSWDDKGYNLFNLR